MIRVAVIGLGRIGSAYDYDGSGMAARSHVGAVLKTAGLTLTGLVDPDPARRQAAAAHWRLPSHAIHADIGGLPADIDVAVICTPSAERLRIVERLMGHCRVGLLVVEKPLAMTLGEAEGIVMLAQQHGTALMVNFQRRLSPRLAGVYQAMAGEMPRKIVARYGRGLHNYGSHLVDLLLQWFGPITEVAAIGCSGEGEDPVLSFHCRMAAGFDVVAIGLEGIVYDQFDLDIFLTDRRLSLVAGGVEVWEQTSVADRFFPGYSHLGVPALMCGGEPESGLEPLWTLIGQNRAQGVPPAVCTAADAIAGLRVLEAARRSAQQSGRTIALTE